MNTKNYILFNYQFDNLAQQQQIDFRATNRLQEFESKKSILAQQRNLEQEIDYKNLRTKNREQISKNRHKSTATNREQISKIEKSRA